MRANGFPCSYGVARLVSVLAFAAAAACTAVNGQHRLGTEEPDPQQRELIWIFDASRTQQSFSRLGRCRGIPFDSIDGAWTPDSQLVRQVDPIVRRAVDAARRDRGDRVTIRGSDYYVQYFGIVVEGHQFIYVNGVHRVLATNMLREPETELAHAPVVVCDAGFGAFQTEFDLQTKQLGPIRFESTYGGPLP